jgi:hypothetical protein
MNAWRVPYEAHMSAVGMLRRVPPYEACGGVTPACRDARLPDGQALQRAGPEPSMVQGRHGLQPVGAPLKIERGKSEGTVLWKSEY